MLHDDKLYTAKDCGGSKCRGRAHIEDKQNHQANAEWTNTHGRTIRPENGVQIPLSSLDNHLS